MCVWERGDIVRMMCVSVCVCEREGVQHRIVCVCVSVRNGVWVCVKEGTLRKDVCVWLQYGMVCVCELGQRWRAGSQQDSSVVPEGGPAVQQAGYF